MSLSKFGSAIEILKPQGDFLGIDMIELMRILENELVRDRFIVPISIVGNFREGKSFFMNYALRYMYANVSSSVNLL
jgi:hypothetical protein